MTAVRPNNRDASNIIKALDDGDFVHVSLIIGDGFFGRVLQSGDKVRMIAHQAASNHFDQEACLAWEVIIPWSAILWVRHLKHRPVGCPCVGA